MKKNVFKVFFTAFAASYASITSVFAESCSWLPQFLCDLVGGDNPVTRIEYRVRAAFFIAIGAIILVAIAYGLYNAYKYIKSGGGDGMEEANKGMRSILFGIGSIFVILLGIAAVLLFFGANFLQVMLAPTCISAPDGAGCFACQNQNLGTGTPKTNAVTCSKCNENPSRSDAQNLSPNTGSLISFDNNRDGTINDSDAKVSTVLVNVKCTDRVREFKN